MARLVQIDGVYQARVLAGYHIWDLQGQDDVEDGALMREKQNWDVLWLTIVSQNHPKKLSWSGTDGCPLRSHQLFCYLLSLLEYSLKSYSKP